MRLLLALAVSLLFFVGGNIFAQGSNAPLDPTYYHLLDRYEISRGAFSKDYFTSYKPYRRLPIGRYTDELFDSLRQHGTQQDVFNLQFLANDNQEWSEHEKVGRKPLLGVFYRTYPDLYTVSTQNFDLHVKPVLGLVAGKENNGRPSPYQNTRGFELRATIDDKVSLYTYATENQVRYPYYVRERTAPNITSEANNSSKQRFANRVVPGQAFWKWYKQDSAKYDFFEVRGHVSVNATKSINVQIGHERFFIGNGIRSLILSDYGPSFPYFKVETKVWRIQYTNMFAQLRGAVPSSRSGVFGNASIPKKFFALHHLSMNITKNLNVGIFEAIVSGDSTSNGIEADYFNPIIFYRAVEQYGGSGDNALIGLDAKWNLWKKFQLYGQLMLDEFLIGNYLKGAGSWTNKWATQLGGKYVNMFGLPNLDGQLEWNRARPFMYSHGSQYTSYSNYAQPLAHPLGANFNEWVGTLRWQAMPRLWLDGSAIYATYGTSPAGFNYGENILEPYTTRENTGDAKPDDENFVIGGGTSTTLISGQGRVSYMLAHRLWLEAIGTVRQQQTAGSVNTNAVVLEAGIRYNLGARNFLW